MPSIAECIHDLSLFLKNIFYCLSLLLIEIFNDASLTMASRTGRGVGGLGAGCVPYMPSANLRPSGKAIPPENTKIFAALDKGVLPVVRYW